MEVMMDYSMLDDHAWAIRRHHAASASLPDRSWEVVPAETKEARGGFLQRLWGDRGGASSRESSPRRNESLVVQQHPSATQRRRRGSDFSGNRPATIVEVEKPVLQAGIRAVSFEKEIQSNMVEWAREVTPRAEKRKTRDAWEEESERLRLRIRESLGYCFW
jgi:hypothetical protein